MNLCLRSWNGLCCTEQACLGTRHQAGGCGDADSDVGRSVQALVQDAVLRWKTGAEGHAPKPEAEEDVEVALPSKHPEGLHLMASHQHSTA